MFWKVSRISGLHRPLPGRIRAKVEELGCGTIRKRLARKVDLCRGRYVNGDNVGLQAWLREHRHRCRSGAPRGLPAQAGSFLGGKEPFAVPELR